MPEYFLTDRKSLFKWDSTVPNVLNTIRKYNTIDVEYDFFSGKLYTSTWGHIHEIDDTTGEETLVSILPEVSFIRTDPLNGDLYARTPSGIYQIDLTDPNKHTLVTDYAADVFTVYDNQILMISNKALELAYLDIGHSRA